MSRQFSKYISQDSSERSAIDSARARKIVAQRAAREDKSVKEYLDGINAVRRAKDSAKAIGLAYWPALLADVKVDRAAFVAAEAVLEKKHGLYTKEGGKITCRGGWDSQGHYGLSPYAIAKNWYAAGCRDTSKFRLQVETGVLLKKGDSFPFAVAYVKGRLWLSRQRELNYNRFGRKAIAALGRLSADLRWAAVSFLNRQNYVPTGGVIRVRDLDWETVKKVQSGVAIGNTRLAAAYAPERRAAELLGCEVKDIAAKMCPAYPKVGLTVARDIFAGKPPAKIFPELTKKEAHRYLAGGAAIPVNQWLARQLSTPMHRSVRVIRWFARLQARGAWGPMERERVAHGPAGEQRKYRYVDILDEIQDIDVHAFGEGVERVFERALERQLESFLEKLRTDHRVIGAHPAWLSHLPRSIRLLDTPSKLVAEGDELGHCVGGYSRAVESGSVIILGVSTKNGRSTIELDVQSLEIYQHHAAKNADPHPRDAALAKAAVNRILKETGRVPRYWAPVKPSKYW
ncbi:MAG: PcfJ domain-containing protein [Betaproteobacteria bacterium]